MELNFWAVFESAPDAYLLLAPDSPRFTMVAANEARLRATMSERKNVVGHSLFEVFPDNPDDPGATGVRNLRASLEEVIRSRKPHRMALQKYDIRRPDGSFEERYWDPLNSPVVDEHGNLIYIIHRVEDVTEQVRTGRRVKEVEALLAKLRESEARYRLLVDMIPQNIWTTDAQGHHTYFSRRWYEFTGAGFEESQGEAWVQYIHPDDKERMRARWKHSLETGEPYEIEYRFRGVDGRYHWFLGKALPLRDGSNRIIEWFGTATDITERKRIDEERERILAREREAKEDVTTILESITDAFFAVDHAWRFTYVNREAERLLQRPRQELMGKVLWDEFSPAVGSVFQEHYERAMTKKETVKFEAYYEPLGMWTDVRAYPSNDGISVFFRDITRRKRAEDRLRQSEEQYRLLADMIPQHIWTADPDGQILYASRRWYEFTGNTPEQSLGEAWIATLHPDDREATLAAWEHSLRTGEPLSAEYRFRSAAGDYHWFLGKAVPERDAEGRITRWFGTLTDISEKKKFEESFRVLANTIPQLAWMADENGSIFWYNDRWMEYTGSTLEAMRGWGWQAVHHPDHVKGVVERIRHSFETGTPWEDTFPLRGKDGTYRWFLSRATPIRDASGKVTRWFGTNTDVTDQMEAAAERERVTESRTRLMRGFSHDLKNPLGAADGFAQLLEDGILGELTDKQRDSVRRIRRSIQTSLRLIQELLELARAEAGEIEVDCTTTNVSTITCEAADDVRAQAATAKLSLDIHVPNDLHADTDAARVRQVLSNLLSNAVKYTEQGGVTVAAKVDRESRRIAISVTDTGPGIPPEKQESIFQEFTRLDPDAKPGAGIGLAISRRIARLLGGDITVTSELGRGSTFTLWLPEAR